MATATDLGIDFERIRKRWFWFFLLGLLLVLAGGFAIGHPLYAGLIVVEIFGWLLIFSGVTQLLFSTQMWGWGGVALSVLSGVLQIVLGALIVYKPAVELQAFLVFTLLLIVYFLVGGVFRVVAAFALRVPGATWLAISGLVSAGLGVWLLLNFKQTYDWLLGTFVGVDLVVQGASWMILSLEVRSRLNKPA